MAVDPDVTGSFIMDKLEEIGPTRLMALIRPLLSDEIVTAIANLESLAVANADGEAEPGHGMPNVTITNSQISILDEDGNSRVLTATGDVVTPALPGL